MDSVYTAKSYKGFLLSLISSQPAGGRGVRKQLAHAIGCQMAYVTQVLKGNAHFSAEQAEASARFFQLNDGETQFLLLLLGENRAGTVSLRKFYRDQIEKQRERFGSLKKRLAITADLPRQFQTIYYGSWAYGAVHMAVHSPALRDAETIAKHFGLPASMVNKILLFLERHGLVKKGPGGFFPLGNAHHLRKNSPFLPRHHTNWRLKAIEAAEMSRNDTLQYSGVITCSREDLEKIRDRFSQFLQDTVNLVRESPPEEIAVLNFDLFGLGGSR